MAQFASFYPGAMSEARLIELLPIVQQVGEPDFVLIAADDPEGMLRHTRECRQRGYRFIADPSQQLAFSEGELIRDLIDGATYLFSNEYESAMIESKTGWSAEEILDRVGTQVTTLGDAFRAGFLAGLEWELGHERSAQVGCVLAAYVVETVGTQEYAFTAEQFVDRPPVVDEVAFGHVIDGQGALEVGDQQDEERGHEVEHAAHPDGVR